MALFKDAEGIEKISAVVFLAEGAECRCLQLLPNGTIQDMIEHMLQVHEDWQDNSGSRPLKMRAGADSSTDDERDNYGIVLVTKDASGKESERLLSRMMRLDAAELRPLRMQWNRIIVSHIAARFRFANKQKGAVRKASKRNSQAGSAQAQPEVVKPPVLGEYWFKSRGQYDGSNMRVKFVSTEDYRVSRPKEGWVDVKDGGSVKSRWVVVKENTLYVYKDPEAEEPLLTVDNVDQCMIEIKKGKSCCSVELTCAGKKDAQKLKLKKASSKFKLSLVCENDLVCERWREAIKQGKSGVVKPAEERAGIKLRLGAVVEDIPEYSEEEEMADLLGSRAYISVDMIQAAISKGPLTAQGVAMLAIDAGCLAPEEVGKLLVTESGTYMTVEDMQSLLRGGVFTSNSSGVLCNSQGEYLTLDEILSLARSSGFVCLEDLAKGKPKANAEESYLSLESILKLRDSGYLTMPDTKKLADAGYITHEHAKDLMDSGYLSLPEIAKLKDGGYLSSEEMQRLGDGGYLSADELQRLSSAGYLTIEEMKTLKDAGYMSTADMRKLASSGYLTIEEARKLKKTGRPADGGYLSTDQMKQLVSAGYLTILDMQELSKTKTAAQ